MTVPRWVDSPNDDLGGRRMSIVRELVNEVSSTPEKTAHRNRLIISRAARPSALVPSPGL
jgi:hypothetical protein